MPTNRHSKRSLLVSAILSSSLSLVSLVPAAYATSVDLFPVPVSATTMLFPSVDDDYLGVAFTQGFTFNFYGATYSSIFLNTNGGFTFRAGNWDYDVAATGVLQPGVAIFWGDLNAAAWGADTRANQMTHEQFTDKFVITYTQVQDNDDSAWNNTATVTLSPDGTIVINYGTVLSTDILVGIFDGTHADNRYMSVQSSYSDYQTTGTGIILFDYWGLGPDYAGELDYRTIVFLSEAGGGGATGDVNGDGAVDILDAILVMRMALGL